MPSKYNRKDFLDALFFNYCRDKGGFIMVRVSDRHMVKTSTRYFPNPDTLVREQYADDQNVLFGVCPREKMKPGKEFIRHITAVWAGLDIGPDGYSGKERHFISDKQAVMAVKSFPLEPSIVVQSGRGLHLYWLLQEIKEITDCNAVETVLRRVNDFFQCRAEVNLETTLRLPETWNPKHPSQPLECRVHYMDASARYRFSEFESLDLRVIIPSKKTPRGVATPAPPLVRSRVTVIQDVEEPEDASNGQAPRSGVYDSPASAAGAPPTSDVHPLPIAADEIVEALPAPKGNDPGERLLEEFMDRLSEKVLDELADKIVDKLLQRLPAVGAKRP